MSTTSLKVVIAPSGFKECLTPKETADAIATGVRHADPQANIIELPLVDGGEEFTHTMVDLLGGKIHEVTVTGPLGEPVTSYFGMLDNEEKPTAVIEMAAAAGISLIPKEKRDPLVTTTFGVGELIKVALDAGAKKILVGCGDSGTNDGGAGSVQALGVRLLNKDGSPIARGGGGLAELATIDLSGRDPRLDNSEIILACNINKIGRASCRERV